MKGNLPTTTKNKVKTNLSSPPFIFTTVNDHHEKILKNEIRFLKSYGLSSVNNWQIPKFACRESMNKYKCAWFVVRLTKMSDGTPLGWHTVRDTEWLIIAKIDANWLKQTITNHEQDWTSIDNLKTSIKRKMKFSNDLVTIESNPKMFQCYYVFQ